VKGRIDKLKKLLGEFRKRVGEITGRLLAASKSLLLSKKTAETAKTEITAETAKAEITEKTSKTGTPKIKESIRQKRVIAAYLLLTAVVFTGVYFGQSQRAEFKFEQNRADSLEDIEDEVKEVTLLPDSYLEEKTDEIKFEEGQAENKENFIWPVTGEIMANFHDIFNIDNQYRFHHGIDIEAASKTEVKAVLSGLVEEIKVDPVTGNTVVISHQDEIKTIYGNLSLINVKVKEEVGKGQVIASVGDSAGLDISKGYFLHFGVEEAGQYRDPLDYLP